jgi:PAS domain S-box-containing protein
MSHIPVLVGSYDFRLVTLSIAIAILASFAALDLASRIVDSRGGARVAWLTGGAFVMGSGIWAMHYVGMNAFHLSVPIWYDWPTVLISWLAAVLASLVALWVVSRPTMGWIVTMLASVVMGDGIAATHYIGMAAMRVDAMHVYRSRLVGLSVLLAVGFSFVALKLAFAYRSAPRMWSVRKAVAAIVMGVGIASMHYVGMVAVRFTPSASIGGSMARAIDSPDVSLVGVVGVTLLLLAIVFVTSTLDRRFSTQAKQLIDTQLHLRTIFDTMTEGIVVLDREGKLVAMNKAAELLFLMKPQDDFLARVRGSYEVFALGGESIPPERWPVALALRGEFSRGREYIFRRLDDGRTGVREIGTAPVPDGQGGYRHIVMSYRDNTERHKTDEARNRLAAIVESSEDAIIGKDSRGFVTSWNRGAQKLFGYSSEEMIGQSIRRLIPAEREREEDQILERILRDETVDHFDTTRLTKSGSTIHVSLTVSPIKDARGKVIGASKIARDITQRKMLEDQLHQSQKLEAVGQLTGGIAHDFNNLLGVIIGNLDLLERLVSEQPEVLRHVRKAQRASVRGADLTRRLLTFASSEELLSEPTQLDQSIVNMMEIAERALGPEIKISMDLDPSMPPVLVDVARLESAILNLVVNARDAMPGGGTLTITTDLRQVDMTHPSVNAGELKVGRYAHVCISDTGQGMQTSTLVRAFDPFFTTKARGKGTGLGLAMVYGFARQSGGTVRLYSEWGYGTSVSIYLPLAELSSAPSTEKVIRQMSGIRSAKVLVVDDEMEILEIAASYLEEIGFRAFQASSGPQALAMLAREPDMAMIITDIVMGGGMNGVELVEQVRRISPEILVIYSSGFPAAALAEKSLQVQDAPLLRKPYQRADFAQVVKHAIRREPVQG